MDIDRLLLDAFNFVTNFFAVLLLLSFLASRWPLLSSPGPRGDVPGDERFRHDPAQLGGGRPRRVFG